MRTGAGVCWMLAALLYVGAASAEEAAKPNPPPKLPPGVSVTLWRLAVPPGLEPTPEKAALGEKLFRDSRLSADNTVSCLTCHDPDKGFVDGKVVSEGVGGKKGTRNAPTVLNAMFNASQFWDGRAHRLEDQAKLPITNPVEMAMPNGDAVVAKVRAIPEYASAFLKLYGREPTFDDIAAAITAFEFTQYSGNARFDKFLMGDEKALDAQEKRGWALFNGKGRCNECHAANLVSPLFSDQKFHNIGIAAHNKSFVQLANEALKVVRSGDEKQIDELALNSEFSEVGRFLVTKNRNDVGAFKTPNLRNVGVTGPYMHDGTLTTLWDVMDHYNKGGVQNPFLDGGMQRLGLSEAEIDDMVAFLFTLTDERYAKYNQEQLMKQRARKNMRPQRDTEAALGKKNSFGDANVSPDLQVQNPAKVGAYGNEALQAITPAKAKK